VLVVVSCEPSARTVHTSLSVSDNGAVLTQRGAGADEPWEISLRVVQTPYRIDASCPGQQASEQITVRPPFAETKVTLP
jgi:hypothetical protein